jgi:signal transduction histidine kinase
MTFQTHPARPPASAATRREPDIELLRARIAELEREKAEAEAFAAEAAHELLTPLVMIDAHATMAAEQLDDEFDADALRNLDALQRGAALTRLLVETLLHAASSRGYRLRRSVVDLNTVLGDCLSLLAPEIQFRGAEVQVAKLPDVLADEALIGAVFSNLLINALKYGPRHSGTIRVDATFMDTAWRLSVQSQGPMIPVQDRDRIFEPYNRGRGERRARGAGLGLAICRQIVERYGGQIGVTATGQGENRFWFTLPATG